jgi:hypothetical protein
MDLPARDRLYPISRSATVLVEQATTGSDREMDTETLTGRDRAILRAIAGGGAELVAGSEPDLLLDGRCCCDQVAVHRLARAGLIAGVRVVAFGERVPARLTPAGTARLAA